MARYTITLRNLYKVLTKTDFPMPSHNVLSGHEKAGLVQNAFLQEMCIPELQCGQTGMMLWRNTEVRNRTFSSMCNRTLRPSTYEKYAEEIAKQISPRLVYNQARRFGLFLVRHEYDHEVLSTRLTKLIEIANENGEIEKDIYSFLISAKRGLVDRDIDETKKGFEAGFLLTWLFIYAMTDSAFSKIIAKVSCDPGKYELQVFLNSSDKNQENRKVKYYGSLRSIAGGTALPAHKYFGHEDELLDLRDAILSQGKIWIHGIGGIGKTEIVRQIIRQCTVEHIIDSVCMIQYTHNLAFSIRKCFPNYDVNSSDASNKTVKDILVYLADKLGKNGLVIIDNMDHISEEDRDILNCLLKEQYAVVITSRMAKMPGFVGFPLRECTPQECLSIYRANLGSVMSAEDKYLFLTLMQNTVLCHPQTVYLLSKTAKSRRMSFENIIEALQGNALLVGGKCQVNDLVHMYKTLYSLHDLSEDERRLTDFFTMLPINSYEADWLEKNFDVHKANATDLAKSLASAGILNESDNGFSMHPLVAQCLRKKSISESRLNDLFGKMADNHLLDWEVFAKIKTDVRYLGGLYRTTCEVLFHLSDLILKHVHTGNLILSLSQIYYVFDVSFADYTRQKSLLNQRLHTALDNELADKVCLILNSRYMLTDECTDRYITIARNIMTQKAQRCKLDTCFLINLGFTLVQSEYVNDSIEILENGTENSTDVVLKLTGYGYLAERCYFSGQIQKSSDVVHKALKMVDEQKDINALDKAIALGFCFNLLLACKEYDNLLHRIDELEAITAGDELPVPVCMEYKMIAMTARSNLYMTMGKPDEALQIQLDYGKYIAKSTGTDSYEYVMVLHTIAMIYRALGDVVSSQKYFEDSLQRVSSSAPVMVTLLILNNYAVLCLENNNTKKALELLNKALEVPLNDDTPRGEVYRNFGRVYDILHQNKESLMCWKKAAPLLAKLYGPDHERTLFAENRIKELSALNAL